MKGITMRTDYHWNPTKPTDAERNVLNDFAMQLDVGGIDMEPFRLSRDAPDLVLSWLDRKHLEFLDWKFGAPDRPITHDHMNALTSRSRVRLFDGIWIESRAVPLTVEANYAIERPPPSLKDFDKDLPDECERHYERRVARVWDTYGESIAAGDEEGCRVLASAIYKYLSLGGHRARILCDAAGGVDERLRGNIEIAQGKALEAIAEQHGTQRFIPVPGDGFPETDVELRNRLKQRIQHG